MTCKNYTDFVLKKFDHI